MDNTLKEWDNLINYIQFLSFIVVQGESVDNQRLRDWLDRAIEARNKLDRLISDVHYHVMEEIPFE